MTLPEFLLLKTTLRYCPFCAGILRAEQGNGAMILCKTHGTVFRIYQTLKGYRVEATFGERSGELGIREDPEPIVDLSNMRTQDDIDRET